LLISSKEIFWLYMKNSKRWAKRNTSFSKCLMVLIGIQLG
jgi:hypothetical protein